MSASPNRKFVDTSILVYAHDASAGAKHRQAKQLLEDLWDSGEGALSVQVLQEFYVAITRKVPRPVSPILARQAVAALGVWPVHTPGANDVLGAIDIQHEYAVSFWDAMIIQSALQLGCAGIVSEDLNPGQLYRGIPIINPFGSPKDEIQPV